VAVLRFLPPDLVAEDLVAKTNSPSLLQVSHQRDILSGSHVSTSALWVSPPVCW